MNKQIKTNEPENEEKYCSKLNISVWNAGEKENKELTKALREILKDKTLQITIPIKVAIEIGAKILNKFVNNDSEEEYFTIENKCTAVVPFEDSNESDDFRCEVLIMKFH